jgi:hypothetical protein
MALKDLLRSGDNKIATSLFGKNDFLRQKGFQGIFNLPNCLSWVAKH